MSNTSAADLFKKSWSTYQQVVEKDLMHHAALSAFTANALADDNSLHPLRILDLGCGDGSVLVKALKGIPVAHYTGYDLSEHALELASWRLDEIGWPFDLAPGRMEEMLRQEDRTFNMVYSGFAIHHLPDEEKRELFRSIADHLEDNGVFIYIDVFRQKGQSLHDYHEGYSKWIDEEWDAISDASREDIKAHLRAYDLPALLDDIPEMTGKVGLVVEQVSKADSRHYFMVFSKG